MDNDQRHTGRFTRIDSVFDGVSEFQFDRRPIDPLRANGRAKDQQKEQVQAHLLI